MITITDPITFRENIRNKLKSKLETTNDTLVSNTEKSIFNYAIKECRNKKIICKWDKPSFVTIYIDKIITITV